MSTSSLNRLAVVTGASSGIGYELALQFADHGYDLVIVAEDEELEVARETIAALGTRVEAIRADLSTRQGVEQVHHRLSALRQPVFALALNAGVGYGGPFLENPFEAELRIINLNIVGTIHLAKLVVRDMVASGDKARVLFTASIAAEMPGPFEAVYAASKAFILSFAQALRNELSDTRVTVTALQPGPTDTDFFARAHMLDTKVGACAKDSAADVARDGFEAMMAGKDHVVAGSLKNRIQSGLSGITPDTILADQHRKLTEPGSAPPDESHTTARELPQDPYRTDDHPGHGS
jgi:short-subunit dehydrogenase